MRKTILPLLAAASLLAACSDPEGARQAVEAYGLNDVQPTGYEAFGCGDHDDVHTGFTATNVRGQRVRGVVCSDFGPYGKAATVRIYGIAPDASAVPMAQGEANRQ